MFTPGASIGLLRCSNVSEVEVTLASNVFGAAPVVMAFADIAGGSIWASADAGTTLCVASPTGRILLDPLRLLDLATVVTIFRIDKGLGVCRLIDTVGTAPFTMCAGHPNDVTVAPSFGNEAEVAFGVIWQIASICLVHSWDGRLNPFTIRGLFQV